LPVRRKLVVDTGNALLWRFLGCEFRKEANSLPLALYCSPCGCEALLRGSTCSVPREPAEPQHLDLPSTSASLWAILRSAARFTMSPRSNTCLICCRLGSSHLD